METTKDYLLNYLRLNDNGLKKLAVEMKTEEFGLMRSRMLNSTESEKMNQMLLNSLADEVIDDYEMKKENNPAFFSMYVEQPSRAS